MIQRVSLQDIPGSAVLSIRSPSYYAFPPVIIGAELIEDVTLSAMRPAWFAKSFAPKRVRLSRLFNVYVVAEGLVFDSDLRVISETITQHTIEDIAASHDLLVKAQNVDRVTMPSLLLRKRGETNFGHWLVEMLPKLVLTLPALRFGHITVPKMAGALGQVIEDSLNVVAGSKLEYYGASRQSITLYDELLVVDGLTEHGAYMSPLVLGAADKLSESVAGTGNRKIYISRRSSPRNFQNADEVEGELRQAGFIEVNPGVLSLKEQIASIKDAEVVVGIMGAGMTNMIFCAPNTKIINIAPASMPDTFFYLIAALRHQRYVELRYRTEAGSTSWDSPVIADIAQLMDAISL